MGEKFALRSDRVSKDALASSQKGIPRSKAPSPLGSFHQTRSCLQLHPVLNIRTNVAKKTLRR